MIFVLYMQILLISTPYEHKFSSLFIASSISHNYVLIIESTTRHNYISATNLSDPCTDKMLTVYSFNVQSKLNFNSMVKVGAHLHNELYYTENK